MNKERALQCWSVIIDLRKKSWTDEAIADYLKIKEGDLLRIMKTVFYPSAYRKISNKKKIKKVRGYKSKARNEGRDYIKSKVRKRDKNKCRACGRVHEEGTRAFDVVFKDMTKAFGKKYVSAREVEKLQTVCHKCNTKIKYDYHHKSNKII